MAMSRERLMVSRQCYVESVRADKSATTHDESWTTHRDDDSWLIQPINRGVWLTFWHRFLKRRSAAILGTRLQHFFIFFSPFQSNSNIHPRSKIEIEDPRDKVEDLHPTKLDFIVLSEISPDQALIFAVQI